MTPGRWQLRAPRPLATILLAAAALWSATTTPAALASDFELTAVIASGIRFPPDRWVPVRCEVLNRGDRSVRGRLVIPTRDRAGAAVLITSPVSVAPRSRTRAIVYAYFPAETESDDQASDVAAATTGPGAASASLTVVQFRSDDGALLARCPLPGQPDSTSDTAPDAGLGTFLLTVVPTGSGDADDDYGNPSGLADSIAGSIGTPVTSVQMDESRLPRDAAGLHAARFIVLHDDAIEELDTAQRKAVLDRVRGGAVLIVPGPFRACDPATTWLSEVFPVRQIGKRQVRSVPPALPNAGARPDRDTTPRKFGQPRTITEAVHVRGDVVLRDDHFVYAAFDRLGAGRIVFTAFPIDAMDFKDQRVARVWAVLLDLADERFEWAASKFPEVRDEILASMIGSPTASWRRAVAMVLGYISACVLPVLLFRGVRRPIALGLGLGVAVTYSLVLIALGSARQDSADAPLAHALIATLDLGQQGGVREEAAAFLGRENPDFALRAALGAALRPAASLVTSPPTLLIDPFAAPNAGVHEGRIDRVWTSASGVTITESVQCVCRFGPQGLALGVKNSLGQPLRAPMLLWGGERFALADLPVGESLARVGAPNPSDDFMNASVVTSELSKLRGQVLRALHTPRAGFGLAGDPGIDPAAAPSPLLVGWCDRLGTHLIEPVARETTSVRSLLLVRVGASVEPSPIGSDIRINRGLARLRVKPAEGLPYDARKRRWIGAAQTGNWLLAFAPPAQIGGGLRPRRATLHADVSAPGHTLVLRRGQCEKGSAQGNPQGAPVARWASESASRVVAFEANNADFDSNGWVWLRVEVEEDSSGSAGVGPRELWTIRELSMEIDARREQE
jgi:hypothetical protein